MGKTPRKSKAKGKVPPPRCKALLLCDHTIVEVGTGKVSLIGVFTNFFLPQLPGRTSAFTAFMQLTDGIGRYEIVVEVHDLRDDRVLARAQALGIEFPQRLFGINICLPVPPLSLAHSGAYDVVVFANGQAIERQKFTAISPPEPGHVQDDPA